MARNYEQRLGGNGDSDVSKSASPQAATQKPKPKTLTETKIEMAALLPQKAPDSLDAPINQDNLSLKAVNYGAATNFEPDNGMSILDLLSIPASFFVPLLVDELRENGFENPKTLIAKAGIDGALFLLPPVKVAALGLKATHMLGTKVAPKIGNKLLTPYTSQKASERILGQAAANTADNAVATTTQQILDNQERTIGDVLSEQAIGALFGGVIGAGSGVNSFSKLGPFESKIAQKTKAKPDGTKQEAFDMRERFSDMDDIEMNKDMAMDLIKKYSIDEGLQFNILPQSWPTINKKINEGIDYWTKQKLKRAEKTIPNGDIPTNPKRGAFDNAKEKEKWSDNINSWLEHNGFGKFEYGNVTLNEGISIAEVEAALKNRRRSVLTSKEHKDWIEELRIALRQGRGGDKYVKGAGDDGSYGYAMKELEKLQRDQVILNYTQGGFGYNENPHILRNVKAQLAPEHRPGMGLYDYSFEILPRRIPAAATNAYKEIPNIAKAIDTLKTYGENSDLFQDIYKNLSIEEKNQIINIINNSSNNQILPNKLE